MGLAPESDIDSAKAPTRWRPWYGCLLAALVLLLLPVLLYGGCRWRQARAAREARAAQENRAEEVFQPAVERLAEAVEEPAQSYDIDRTVRTMHGIDTALEAHQNLPDYLRYLAKQDYRDVAPDVLRARSRILDVLRRLYAKQTQADSQRSLWQLSSEFMLSLFSVVDLGVEASSSPLVGGLPEGQFGIDREQAKLLLTELKQRQQDERRLIEDLDRLEGELLDAMVEYARLYYDYLAEWDRLCLLRDRAYLAAHRGDWSTAVDTAQAASQLAPREREAHLLWAMGLLEQSRTTDAEGLTKAASLLTDYLEAHPESSAPALLLLGNYYRRRGDLAEAASYYEQSTAYYPRQAATLTDMLAPYRLRGYLRQTREGNFIVGLYTATMLGAGYFSPDLQMARLHFEAGDAEAGKRKVLDHFARRRTQGKWDLVVSDIEFCYQLLGRDFTEIFPQDCYLDLVTDTQLLSARKLGIGVRNRSQRALRNATLVLCLNLTDMYPGDYETVAVGRTLPVVPPHEVTDFGTLTLDLERGGKRKTIADIVAVRAILISNDAVVWVDTDAYKMAEAIDAAGRDHTAPAWQPPPGQIRRALDEVRVSVQPSVGRDHLVVSMPASLAALRPVFRLDWEGQQLAPDHNVIIDQQIRLRFRDLIELTDDGALPVDLNATLEIFSTSASFKLDVGVINGRLAVKAVRGP